MNHRALIDLVLFGAFFLAGLYARPHEPVQLIPVNRPVDVVTVASLDCGPEHYPDFASCRVLVQEWNENGEVYLSFVVSPDDPVSRIFE